MRTEAQTQDGSQYKIEIQGFVFDESCSPMEGVFVNLSEGGLVKGGAQTDRYGYYKISFPYPGRFDIEARTATFKCIRKSIGYLSPGSSSTIEFDMEYGHYSYPRGGHKVPLIDRFTPADKK